MTVAVTPADVGTLYAQHRRWLSGWLVRRTRCPDRADDLAQDAFRKLLEAPETLPIRDPRNYLATIARRILIDDLRRRDVERSYLASLAWTGQSADQLTPERIAEAVQALDAVLALLESLPSKVCRGFIMIRFEGMAYADAARVLGVSDRMVKTYVAQAYARCYALAYPT
jgi:RNA polymerase sigma-19 factor, ECF subfamily